MRVKTAILGAAAAFAVSAVAQAAVVVNIVQNPDPAPGLSSYTVRMVADTEANRVTAFQGSFTGDLNQVGAFGGALATPTLTNAAFLTPDERARDTHFLFTDGQLLPAETPAETATSLSGAFGIVPAATAQDLALAQIVMQSGGTVTLNGMVVSGTGATQWEGSVVIPEPATMGLLAPLALGLLARRRRVA
jgi:hypothetical protein